MSRTTMVLLLATVGWGAFWSAVAAREHSWWTLVLFSVVGTGAVVAIVLIDRRDRKQRP